MRRVLVAGFGNELRGDDAFGIRVLEALRSRVSGRDSVELFHVGIGGLRLAQELLAGYHGLVVVDALQRSGFPGTLYVLEIEDVTVAERVDLHAASPARALSVAKALGALPGRIWMVGCEPEAVDELNEDLSPRVRAQVEPAARAIMDILDRAFESEPTA